MDRVEDDPRAFNVEGTELSFLKNIIIIIYPLSWAVVERGRTEFHVGSLSERYALRIRQTAEHRSFTAAKSKRKQNNMM